jgi:hypothetical protein
VVFQEPMLFARSIRENLLDLPEPVVPTSATVSPARAENDTPSSAGRRPS